MGDELWSGSSGRRAAVLLVDPELGAELAPDRRGRAEELSVASVYAREPGIWNPREEAHQGRDGFGLLVLEGMLVRRVGLQQRYGAELLGPGDVLQPARHDGDRATLPYASAWRILSRLRLAVLDHAWVERMAPFPEVSEILMARVLVRSRRLAAMMAISHHPRLEERLWLFFWEVADRFGRVRPDGVAVPLPMTHELISQLVGAQRPSVSTALMRLERAGRLARRENEWLLRGDPPTEHDLVERADIA